MRTLIETFGTNLGGGGAYVARTRLDEMTKAALHSGKHVILFGQPGQGKSALLRNNMDPAAIVCFVQCARKQNLPDVYRQIIANANVSVTTDKKISKKRKLSASVKIFSAEGDQTEEHVEKFVTIDLGNIVDVARILKDSHFNQRIVVNDFHHLSYSAQFQLANDLKYLFENTAYRLIVVGCWLDETRMLDLNSQLGSYIEQIHVDPWPPAMLLEVLKQGERALNIRFSDPIRKSLCESAYSCIRNLHELAFEFCRGTGYNFPLSAHREIADEREFNRAVDLVYGRSFRRYDIIFQRFCRRKVIALTETQIRQEARDPPMRGRNIAEAVAELKARIAAWNEKWHRAALIRRGVLNGLVKRRWADEKGIVDLPDLAKGIDDIHSLAGKTSLSEVRKAVKKLESAQEDEDLWPLPISYDRIGDRIHIQDCKMIAYLQRTSAADLSEFYHDHTVGFVPYRMP